MTCLQGAAADRGFDAVGVLQLGVADPAPDVTDPIRDGLMEWFKVKPLGGEAIEKRRGAYAP